MPDLKTFIKTVDGDFFDDWAFAAYVGFKNRGFIKDKSLFFYEDIMEVPAKKTNIVVGPIEDSVIYFERLGVDVPEPLNIPESLRSVKYLGRTIHFTTLGVMRNSEIVAPAFIKSHKKLKLFPSTVITNQFDLNLVTQGVSDDTAILYCTALHFESEYRCFVNKGKLVGIKHYLGDYTKFPDMRTIWECIKTYFDSPVSYTIDFAVTKEGLTRLIECNDAWSIGHYGLDEKVYTTLLVDRWMELMFGINRS